MKKQNSKDKLRNKINRIRMVDDLCKNSVRVSKWTSLISDKLSSSPDFIGKEEILDEMKRMRNYMSFNTVEFSNDLKNEVTEELLGSSSKNDLKRIQKFVDFNYHITEGMFLSDIQSISLKDGEGIDLVNELIDMYFNSTNEKSKLFFNLYESDSIEFFDMILGEVLDWKELGSEELMTADIMDECI
jgi:hypothetical protein